MTNCKKIHNVWPIVLFPIDSYDTKGAGFNKEFICTSVGCLHGATIETRKRNGAVSVVFIGNASKGYCINCIEEFMSSVTKHSCSTQINPYNGRISIVIPHQKTRRMRVKAYHFVRAILSAFRNVRIYSSGVEES